MSEKSQKPTPAELAALEHAFAADPGSDAYRALVEGYLAHGRFMEAMVVCKKGVRANPESADGRILLARVYAEQGKDRKALEELAGALELSPTDVGALELAVSLHLRAREPDAARMILRDALEAAADEAPIRALADKHGIELPAPAPAAPAAPAVQAPAAPTLQPAAAPSQPASPAGAAPILQPSQAPVLQPQGHQPSQAPVLQPRAQTSESAPPSGAPMLTPTRQPQQAPRAPAAAPRAPVMVRSSDWDDDAEPVRRTPRGLIQLAITFVVLSVAFGGWSLYSSHKRARDIEVKKLLDRTNDELRKDTYASYKEAAKLASQILELDSGHTAAHAYLAHINALRWGEQGEGDDFRRRAREHLDAAKKGDLHGRAVAAESLLEFYGGDPRKAEETLRKVLDGDTRSGLLYTTLGFVQMGAGDLDKAGESLRQAQQIEPNSVRVLAALGQLNRRRGMDGDAWTFYDSALRLDGEHADSLLGKALLILDAHEADRTKEERAQLLKEAEQQIDKVLGLPEGAVSARQLAVGKFARAQLLYARGKKDEGGKLEQEAFTLDPSNPDTHLMRGRRLLREGDVDGAVASIRKAIDIDPKRASFYVDLSNALLAKRGGAKEAVAALRKAIESFPKSSRLHLLLGDAMREVPDVDGARAAYEKAIEVEGGKLPEARAKIGQIWREKGELAKAAEELEKAVAEFGLRIGPNLALALTEQGRLLEEGPKADRIGAFEKYEKAIRASDTYAPPYFFLGRMSAAAAGRDRQQRKQSIDTLETYLRLDPRGEYADQARALLAQLR